MRPAAADRIHACMCVLLVACVCATHTPSPPRDRARTGKSTLLLYFLARDFHVRIHSECTRHEEETEAALRSCSACGWNSPRCTAAHSRSLAQLASRWAGERIGWRALLVRDTLRVLCVRRVCVWVWLRRWGANWVVLRGGFLDRYREIHSTPTSASKLQMLLLIVFM